MSDSHWNAAPGFPGHPGHERLSATGIAEVLEAYSTQGGQLLGARRWAPNPLTLTHVRWMGPRGMQMDAVRAPENDAKLDEVELQVWVELAVGFPAMHPSAMHSEATWLVLDISQQQAAGLAVRLARALTAVPRPDYVAPSPSTPSPFGVHDASPYSAPGARRSGAPTPFGRPFVSNGQMSPIAPSATANSQPAAGSVPPTSWQGRGPASGGGAWGATQDAHSSANQGSFARGPIFDDGVSVIPSVEIELPGAGMPGVTPASVRDFAQDAAATFVRAMKSVPQARELRGWMRAGRMVLAARLIMAPGAGIPTAQEREDAMQLLARAMARHTLPFAQVGIADPGEWSQAQTLTGL